MAASAPTFNTLAATYDNKTPFNIHADVVALMSKLLTVTARTKVMDFGSGTGLLTEHFEGKVASILCIDPSQGMCDELNKKVAARGWPNITTLCTTLEGKTPDDAFALVQPHGAPFDLIISSMTMHHVQDVAGVIKCLARCLAPGGVLCFVDLEKTEQSHKMHPVAVHHLVRHHGLPCDTVKIWMDEAGLVNTTCTRSLAMKREVEGEGLMEFPLWLAMGNKP
ncbi:class I SAM-dependent methyltransferase [Pelomyxa schiedti]|nr:class I SAM-dependent methyltransferase [Pelomyxa schiedti]